MRPLLGPASLMGVPSMRWKYVGSRLSSAVVTKTLAAKARLLRINE
ncbi:MAG: hypothetical protein JRJ16_09235 [Deltaproteobacteria bacterium]|nr:hypothetical protein [Deltaproteobacteria bacterium]